MTLVVPVEAPAFMPGSEAFKPRKRMSRKKYFHSAEGWRAARGFRAERY
jgi:hypothetical protein